MKKLARLAFCEKEKINHNKILSYSKKIGKVMSEGYPTLFFFCFVSKMKTHETIISNIKTGHGVSHSSGCVLGICSKKKEKEP